MSPRPTIAHYHVTSKLGEGGMGEVWRATDTKLNRDVAIKVLPDSFAADPDRLARFTREAQVLASLNHPNIAAIYGVEELALIMELVEGATLAERIAQGPLPLEEALPIARQIADALEYAHQKAVIHRDLKPANIKITPDGTVKVLDFGLAKALSDEAPAGNPAASPTLTMRATMAGVIMGTAGYMSPEQARGQTADRRSDIWSFGTVLYEMLTGRQMFGGDTVSDSLAAVLKTDPDWSALPAETPPAIRRLLRRCLERDRKRRLSDIADARLEIDEALSGVPEGPVPAAAPERSRRSFGWWSIAALVLAVGGLAFAFLRLRDTPSDAPTVRFQIAAPEGSDFARGGMALSPDGRRLAFIATLADGRSMLWVRPLDSLEARPLPGTEGASFLPFWSPDSRFVAFGVLRTLKKIDASGGPPQTLCEIPGVVLGGSWNRDGTILFGYNADGLYRVPQAGGVPVKATTLDEATGEIGHLRPWFLPDGRHFLYVARMRSVQENVIYLGTLDGKERKRLTASRQSGVYAPPAPGEDHGHLVFLRESTLMAWPMDPKSYDLAGEAFPVAEQVGSILAMGYFSVSATGALAFRSGGSTGFGETKLAWFDRAGKSSGAIGPPAAYSGSIALSPDGQRVAAEEIDPNGNRDIWLIDVGRGVPTRFTFDAGQDRDPVWSADGSRVAFASDRGAAFPDIYQKLSNGSANEELLLKTGSALRPTGWSRDGRHLLYETLDAKSRSDLYVFPVSPATASSVPYLQAPFSERQGQFSPDGRWIAYISDEAAAGQYQVYVQSFPAGAGKFQISTGGGGTQPKWGRDGKEIFYIATNGMLMAVDVRTAQHFEPGVPRALFDPHTYVAGGTNALSFRYDVAPDGKRFLVNTYESSAEKTAPIVIVLNWTAGVRK
jgi:eukaryotic-like serine/threonine-protein kinase